MATSAAFIDLDEGAAPATPAASKVRIYAKSDGSVYQKDDAGTETGLATGGGGVGSLSVVLKTADETVNASTTLQNDDALVFTAGATNSYLILAHLYYSSAAAADIKFAFTVPAGAVIRLSHDAGRDAAGSANIPDTVVTSSGTACGSHTGQGVGTTRYVLLTCYVRTTGTGGSMQLQWAQNTSDATNTVVHLGSSLLVTTLA